MVRPENSLKVASDSGQCRNRCCSRTRRIGSIGWHLPGNHPASRQLEEEAERAAAGAWVDNGLVFTAKLGTPIEPRNFSRDFKALCVRAGSPPYGCIRRTCVTFLLALGESPRTVMEIVGHSAIEMTMNVYGHVEPSTRRQALDRLNDLLDG